MHYHGNVFQVILNPVNLIININFISDRAARMDQRNDSPKLTCPNLYIYLNHLFIMGDSKQLYATLPCTKMSVR